MKRRMKLWRFFQVLLWERLWFVEGQVIPVRVVSHDAEATWVRWAPGYGARIQGRHGRVGRWIWARVSALNATGHRLSLERWESGGEWSLAAVEGDLLTLVASDGHQVRALCQGLGDVRPGDRLDARIHRVWYHREGCLVVLKPREGSLGRIIPLPVPSGEDTRLRRA